MLVLQFCFSANMPQWNILNLRIIIGIKQFLADQNTELLSADMLQERELFGT
jgi:hypothetical protein